MIDSYRQVVHVMYMQRKLHNELCKVMNTDVFVKCYDKELKHCRHLIS